MWLSRTTQRYVPARRMGMPEVVPSTCTSFTQLYAALEMSTPPALCPAYPPGRPPCTRRCSIPAHLVAAAATLETCALWAFLNVQCRGVVRVSVLPDTDAISTRSLTP